MSPRNLQQYADCNGDHEGFTASQLRSHYQGGCRTTDTKAAVNAYQRALRERHAADAKSATTSDEQTSTGAPDGTAAKEGRGTPNYAGSKPATAPAEEAPVEPTTGEVEDTAAAHPAPKADDRPTSPATPTPAPPTAAPMISSRGAVRRIQALTTLGHTPRAIAHATGLTDDSVWWLMIAPPDQIQTRTHLTVLNAFKRLRVTPLEGAAADRARALAHQHYWPGPYDWDDIDTDPRAPHRSAHKAWDTTALATAIADAKLEQGEPEAFSAEAVLDARAEAGRARVDLGKAEQDSAAAREAEAAVRGELAGVRRRLEITTADLTAVRDQLAATTEARDTLRTETDVAAQRITELEEALTAAAGREHHRLAPVTHIDHPAPEPVDIFAGVHVGPALAAEVSITIERTDRGGVHVTFPASLMDQDGR